MEMDLAAKIDHQTNELIKDCDGHIKRSQLINKIPAELAKDIWNMRQLAALIVVVRELDKKIDSVIQILNTPTDEEPKE